MAPSARFARTGTILLLLAAGLAVAGCQSEIPKAMVPVPAALTSKMKNLAMNETAPIYVRIFKEESVLEVWKERRDGKYALLKTYPICKWSGELGPKKLEGDRQAPEGFYTVTPGQMNPDSSYYLAFNIGYPNAFDRAHGRTGKHLMVHGACSSAGCYSMTDEQVAEIFALARDSFRGGQKSFQVHAFPFRMTPENMARHRDNQNMAFWKNLKRGYDHFEVTQVVPAIDVCDRRYVFDAAPRSGSFNPTGACPAYDIPDAIATAVAAKEKADDAAFQVAVARLEKGDQPAAAPASTAVAAASTPPSPAARPTEEAAPPRRSLFSRIFNRDTQPEPAASAAPAAPQATAVAAAQPDPSVALPKSKPTGRPAPTVAGTAPKPAPAPARVASATPPPKPVAAPAPKPELRPTVADTPAPARPAAPATPAGAPVQSAAVSNFDSRFFVPVPTNDALHPAADSQSGAAPAMKGAAPMVSSGFSSSGAQ